MQGGGLRCADDLVKLVTTTMSTRWGKGAKLRWLGFGTLLVTSVVLIFAARQEDTTMPPAPQAVRERPSSVPETRISGDANGGSRRRVVEHPGSVSSPTWT